ncbi:MAG: hypothetical protein ACHQJ6_05495 [Candidatus Berkiellales bacterium]
MKFIDCVKAYQSAFQLCFKTYFIMLPFLLLLHFVKEPLAVAIAHFTSGSSSYFQWIFLGEAFKWALATMVVSFLTLGTYFFLLNKRFYLWQSIVIGLKHAFHLLLFSTLLQVIWQSVFWSTMFLSSFFFDNPKHLISAFLLPYLPIPHAIFVFVITPICMTIACIVIEQLSIITGLRRSWQLIKNHWISTFLMMSMFAIVAWLVKFSVVKIMLFYQTDIFTALNYFDSIAIVFLYPIFIALMAVWFHKLKIEENLSNERRII